ncbi:hypothetical protein PROFUN_05417 [Planoprotostelium fungivorum]|uniref:Tyrosine-protein kinase catalytic domain-containing protein n=1 Tax=Planoprotostelium fungivorum TaxID=1890364 RepID=A0A2P6NQN0_9EUKA|nr:hypothetical protein PROFUN_05417 [Planoprotostelium fungivorum]
MDRQSLLGGEDLRLTLSEKKDILRNMSRQWTMRKYKLHVCGFLALCISVGLIVTTVMTGLGSPMLFLPLFIGIIGICVHFRIPWMDIASKRQEEATRLFEENYVGSWKFEPQTWRCFIKYHFQWKGKLVQIAIIMIALVPTTGLILFMSLKKVVNLDTVISITTIGPLFCDDPLLCVGSRSYLHHGDDVFSAVRHGKSGLDDLQSDFSVSGRKKIRHYQGDCSSSRDKVEGLSSSQNQRGFFLYRGDGREPERGVMRWRHVDRIRIDYNLRQKLVHADDFVTSHRYDILQGLCLTCYLESAEMIHTDVAARNVLVKGNTAKLSGFEGSEADSSAPEVMVKGEYSYASDIWSFGEVASDGEEPYGAMTDQRIREYVTGGGRLDNKAGKQKRKTG